MGTNKRKVQTLCVIPKDAAGSLSFEKFLNNIKNGKYLFTVSETLHEGCQHVIVYNISLKDSMTLCTSYHLKALTFIDMTIDDASCKFLEIGKSDHSLTINHTEHAEIETLPEENFYLQVLHKFKFPEGWFDCIMEATKILECNSDRYDIHKLIDESLDDVLTGKHKYICRCKLLQSNSH